MSNKSDKKQDEVDVTDEDTDGKGTDGCDVCRYCGVDPCWDKELQPMLLSFFEDYGGYMENNKLRYKMYTEAVKIIYGTCLGQRVRKRVPGCVTKSIRRLAPDETYTGFKDAAK